MQTCISDIPVQPYPPSMPVNPPAFRETRKQRLFRESAEQPVLRESREQPAVRESREQEDGLIRSALAGRQGAFEDLVCPHLTSLNRYARMRVHTDSDAEDVVQQAVLRALRHIHQFRGEASFKTWLSTIAFNEINHNRRAKARAQVHPLHELGEESLADPASSPEDQVQRTQEIENLRQAVRRLPEKYRLMIQLRDLRELNIVETARVLSITVAAAKTRHHRARKLLVRSLRGAKRTA